jgi:apolipoprotein D and lipocalin family protein
VRQWLGSEHAPKPWPERPAKGKAGPVDPSNAKQEVQFFLPFHGACWVIDLGPDFEYAVVGHPNRESLWIPSRTTQLPAAS